MSEQGNQANSEADRTAPEAADVLHDDEKADQLESLIPAQRKKMKTLDDKNGLAEFLTAP